MSAQPPPDSVLPQPPPEDITVNMLNGLFGSGWPNYFDLAQPSGYTGVFFHMLSVFNSIAMAAVAVISVYSVIMGAMNTAYEGKTFGQRMHTVWAPVRWSFSMFLLFPLPAVKISVLQAFLMTATYWGIGLADSLWSGAVDLMAANAGRMTITALPPSQAQTTEGILKSLTAQYFAQKQLEQTVPEFDCQFAGYDFFDSPEIERKGTQTERDESSGLVHLYSAYRGMWDDIDLDPAETEWDKAGTWKCVFSAPETNGAAAGMFGGVAAGTDNLGYISIYCPSGTRSPICKQKIEGIKTLVAKLKPTASALAGTVGGTSPPQVDLKAIADAEVAFRSGVRQSLDKMLSETNNAYGKSLQGFASTAKQYGWGMAGAWYMTMSRFNDGVNSAAENFPVWNPGDLPDYQAVYEELDGYLGAAGVIADKVGLALNTPETRYARNSAIEATAAGPDAFDIFARPFTAIQFTDVLTANEDPLISMQASGEFILSAASTALALQVLQKSWFGDLASGAANIGTFGLASAVMEVYGPYFSAMLAAAMLAGMVFAIYLPAVPFIMWTISILGWLILVGETIIAAPIWAATFSLPEGEGLAGTHARQGFILVLGVLLRPSLMVISFFFSFAMMYVMGQFLNLLLHAAFAGLRAGNVSGMFTFIGLMALTGGLLVAVVHKVYGIVNSMPAEVMKWIQGHGATLGEQESEGRVGGVFGAGAQIVRGGGKPSGGGGKPPPKKPDSDNPGDPKTGSTIREAGGTTSVSNADLSPGMTPATGSAAAASSSAGAAASGGAAAGGSAGAGAAAAGGPAGLAAVAAVTAASKLKGKSEK